MILNKLYCLSETINLFFPQFTNNRYSPYYLPKTDGTMHPARQEFLPGTDENIVGKLDLWWKQTPELEKGFRVFQLAP